MGDGCQRVVRLLGRVTLSAGADNVFNVYPDKQNDPGNPATGYAGTRTSA